MFRTLRPAQLAVDLSFAAVFFLLSGLTVLHTGSALDLVIAVAMCAALGLRRLSPALALGVAWAAAIGQMAFGATAPAFTDLAVLGVLYCTASYGGTLLRWLGLASAGLGAVLATIYLTVLPSGFGCSTAPSVVFALFGFLALLGLSWTLGLLARTARRGSESRQAQALAQRDVVIEQERNRIARDMHDVVAHSLAVVIAQADGARYAAKQDPGAVDSALTTISATAREALGDVRVLLSQLRHSEGQGPQPILADLDRLVAQLRDAGLAVSRVDTGAEHPLPGGQQLALYRIAQEALTNALRHGAPGGAAELRLDWSPAEVALSVSSELGSAIDNPAGHGLAGMRERAALAGGAITIGPDGDRWIVRATVPA